MAKDNGIAYKIRYRIPVGRGKWKHRSETLYVDGKRAARRILKERIEEALGRLPDADTLTFEEFAGSQWKAYLDRRRVKPSTRNGYDSILRLHLLPSLGALRLADIIPGHIQQLMIAKTHDGLSSQSQRNMLTLLQGMFAVAIDDDLIERSPVRRKHRPVVPAREKPVWTPEQALRLGELLALQWRHVDFDKRLIRVRQSLWRGQVVTPKTAESARDVPVGSTLAAELTAHLAASRHIGPEDFVFCRTDGVALSPDTLRKDVLYPILDRLQIPRSKRASGFHGFRHAAASFVNAETGNLKLTQRFLGHADLSTTADRYTHVFDEAGRAASEALERAVFGLSVPSCSPNGEQ